MPENKTVSGLDFDAIRCLGIPLAEKLSLLEDWSEESWPDFKTLYNDLVERLTLSGATQYAPVTGTSLMPFLLPDSDGHLRNSRDFLAKGPLVVSFNRGHWCPYCQLELLALEEIHSKIAQRNGSIISITPQRGCSAKTLRDKVEPSFPVLCDIDNAYALASGLMMFIGDAVSQAYKDFGIDLAADQGNDGMFLPVPATYVVNEEGMIVADYVHPDFRKRMAPQDILQALDTLAIPVS